MAVKRQLIMTSGVKQKHPEYEERAPQWVRMRDAIAGQDVVKSKGKDYLPELNANEDKDAYQTYLDNADYFNATGLTFEAFTGMIFRKSPQIGDLTVEKVLEHQLLSNVDLEGRSAYEFTRDIVNEVNAVGRVGVLYDIPTAETTEMTISEKEQSGIRPYAKMYHAEAIINWKFQNINGINKPVMVNLRESVEQEDTDIFSHDTVYQYRVLRIMNGAYIQQIYNHDEVLVDTIIDIRDNGVPFTHIPFVCINSSHLGLSTKKPPLLDLADTNFSHYRASASLGANIFMFSRITPIFKVSHQYWKEFIDHPKEFGVTKSIVIPTSKDGGDSDAAFLEPKSDFTPIVNHMDRLETRMGAQGARMLSGGKAGVEAAATVRLDMSGELSILSAIADTISRGLGEIFSLLMGKPTEVNLNSDFTAAPMDAGLISSLLMALQAQRISEDQFVDALIRGDAIKSENNIITDTEFTPSPPTAEALGVPAADGELKGREDNVKKKEPLSGPNGLENTD